jgi:rubredoxin---NAD+ reductase
MAAPVVILGSGLAGVSVARELRKLDAAVAITLVTADDGTFYSKPMLSNALAAGKTPAQLAMTPAPTLAAQLGADLRTHTRVTAIATECNAVVTEAGEIAYAKLVVALGAQPIRLPLEGDGAPDVLSVNSLDDYAVFRKRLTGRKRIAILGAGLIGCEFANDLAAGGCAVDVFDIAPQALGRLLPAQSAALFRRRLEAIGVRFHFGSSIVRVDRQDEAFVLWEAKGDSFDADLVLSAIGLKPETALARAAGLQVNRGIVVDRGLAATAPDVFAVGDCAEVTGLNLPFVLPIMQQARALAKTLAGRPTAVEYPAMPVVVKTPACPAVVCPAPAGALGQWREVGGAEGARATFENEYGDSIGFALIGAATAEKQALAMRMPAWL